MSAKERMLAGEVYDASDPELSAARTRARELLARFNAGPTRMLLEELLASETRASGLKYALPITVGNDVWIGGGAIVLPGVTIGDRAVVGAGSGVVKNVPADVVAGGNPC